LKGSLGPELSYHLFDFGQGELIVRILYEEAVLTIADTPVGKLIDHAKDPVGFSVFLVDFIPQIRHR
jgi:hypothetical protein